MSLHPRAAPRLAVLAVAVLAALLAGCGDLPRPFQPERKGDNALLLLPDRAGVAVGTVTGAAPNGEALAEAMAEALRRQNVPSSVALGNRETRWLLGRAEAPPEQPAAPGELRRRIVWELYDANGAPVGEVTRTVTVPADAWRAGDPELLARVAADAAPGVAELVQEPAAVETDLPGYPAGTRIVVEPVSGTPADFARALTQAMTSRLRQRGLPVADRAQPGDIVVTGDLAVGAEQAGQRPLELIWTLNRRGRSEPLGDLRQANPVGAQRLSDAEDPLADTIVRAALPGVMQVLQSGGAGS